MKYFFFFVSSVTVFTRRLLRWGCMDKYDNIVGPTEKKIKMKENSIPCHSAYTDTVRFYVYINS